MILFLFAYLCGSIPFSVLISKLKGVDLRKVGSGNFGATNVKRALGWQAFFTVLFLDLLKAFIPTYLAIQLSENPLVHIGVGFTAILGHSLSIFVKFKGGKGAAPGLGVLLAISPLTFTVVAILAAALIGAFRYVAPVTILCAFLIPWLLWVFQKPKEYIGAVSLVSLFVIIKHKDNIKRLLAGKENKI